MIIESHSDYILPTAAPAPRALDGFDLLVNDWSDYVIRYDYVIDDRRLVAALRVAVSCHPYFSGRKSSSGESVLVDNFSGILFESCQSSDLFPDEIDLLDRRSHGYLCDAETRMRHKVAPTSSKTALLKIKHTRCPNGSVLGVSVWHAIADFGRVVRFFEVVTDCYNGRGRDLVLGGGAVTAATSAVEEGDHSESVVPITAELRQPFLEPFSYCRFQIREATFSKLHAQALMSGSKWSDLLFASAWRILGNIALETRGDDPELFLIQSIEKFSPLPPETFNQLIYPALRIKKDRFHACTVDELAVRIRNTGSFMAARELKSMASVRAWMNRHITRRNYHDYMLRPFHAAIFGSGVLGNNFSATRTAAFDFGEGQPRTFDFLPEAGIRLMILSPYEEHISGHTFVVALFQSEMERFEREFTRLLSHYSQGVAENREMAMVSRSINHVLA